MPQISTPRYSKPRKYILFNTDELMCLKMLAYCLRKYEAACRDKYVLWNRTGEICFPVLKGVLGRGVSFKEIRNWVKDNRGLTLTPNILYQRADKASRYEEHNHYLDCVESSYRSLTQHGVTLTVDPDKSKGPRSFTNAQIRKAIERQNGICCYRGCSLEDGVVGDHKTPYSEGGPTEDWNCAASCVRCNEEKGAMSVFEFGKLVGAQNSRGRKLNAQDTDKT